MGNLQEILGVRVRSLRMAAGVTQEKLAEKAGISLKHLGELERGRSNPTLSSLEALAAALGVSLAEFFNFEDALVSPTVAKQALHDAIDNATDEELQTLQRMLIALKG
jgi:transcriptional regulator with XRE-family HTH domain